MKLCWWAVRKAAYEVNVWLDLHPLAAYLFVITAGFVGLWQLQSIQDAQNHERQNRTLVQGEINRYICQSNNVQDRTLGKLVGISLASRPYEELSEKQQQGYIVFARILKDLNAPAPCGRVVAAFISAKDGDVGEVRRILRATYGHKKTK